MLCCYMSHRRQQPKNQVQIQPGDMDNMDTQVLEDDCLDDSLLHELACPFYGFKKRSVCVATLNY